MLTFFVTKYISLSESCIKGYVVLKNHHGECDRDMKRERLLISDHAWRWSSPSLFFGPPSYFLSWQKLNKSLTFFKHSCSIFILLKSPDMDVVTFSGKGYSFLDAGKKLFFFSPHCDIVFLHFKWDSFPLHVQRNRGHFSMLIYF